MLGEERSVHFDKFKIMKMNITIKTLKKYVLHQFHFDFSIPFVKYATHPKSVEFTHKLLGKSSINI
jgi:hypothetical protein